MWAECPECGEPMEVESVHNGVMMVYHGIHCGWGQAYMAPEDVYQTIEELLAAKRKYRHEQNDPPPSRSE